jgi:hypothetical protein
MIELVHVPNKKKVSPTFIMGITNVQQRMLGAVFERYIVNMCGSYDVYGGGLKYIHCDLIDMPRYLTITLTLGSALVTIFSPRLNVGSYIWVTNFGVTFRTSLKRRTGALC